MYSKQRGCLQQSCIQTDSNDRNWADSGTPPRIALTVKLEAFVHRNVVAAHDSNQVPASRHENNSVSKLFSRATRVSHFHPRCASMLTVHSRIRMVGEKLIECL